MSLAFCQRSQCDANFLLANKCVIPAALYLIWMFYITFCIMPPWYSLGSLYVIIFTQRTWLDHAHQRWWPWNCSGFSSYTNRKCTTSGLPEGVTFNLWKKETSSAQSVDTVTCAYFSLSPSLFVALLSGCVARCFGAPYPALWDERPRPTVVYSGGNSM